MAGMDLEVGHAVYKTNDETPCWGLLRVSSLYGLLALLLRCTKPTNTTTAATLTLPIIDAGTPFDTPRPMNVSGMSWEGVN